MADSQDITCAKCQTTFLSKNQLHKHLRNEHYNQPEKPHHPAAAPNPPPQNTTTMPTTTAPPLPNPPASILPPPTNPPTNKHLNLTVLRRHHPPTTTLDLTIPYAVIYTFNARLSTWEKAGIEGTLFVVTTHSPEHGDGYAVVVLNRRGLENFVLELKRSADVQVTDEYVIVRDGEEGIWGIWVFEEREGEGRGVGEGLVRRAGWVEEGRGRVGRMEEEGRGDEEDGGVVGKGPNLMALLNGGKGVGEDGAPATIDGDQDLRQSQVNLLDLFKTN